MTPLDVQSDVDVLAHVGWRRWRRFLSISIVVSTCVFTSSQFDTTKGDSFGVMGGGGAVGTGTEKKDQVVLLAYLD